PDLTPLWPRGWRRLGLAIALSWLVSFAYGIERWDFFELNLDGPADGNPFVDVELSARFSHEERTVTVTGFYDGAGHYKIRFMPDQVGEWRYVTTSNRPALDSKTGTLSASAATGKNHGPVHVQNTYHFAYADGAPF